VDGAGNHNSGDLVIPANVTLTFLPAYSPELNPQEHIWDEIRENIFKNYAAKSMDEVCDKLVEAALYIERNPKMVKSMTSFPYIMNSLWSASGIRTYTATSAMQPACREQCGTCSLATAVSRRLTRLGRISSTSASTLSIAT